jgi:uncharacterized cupin superfamily protein
MTKQPTTIDPKLLPERVGNGYPAPFHADCKDRRKRALGDAGGLSQYGVNLVTLPAGQWSAQRHWHSHEDEFVWIVSGELVLVTDAGEEVLGAGMAAAFPAGKADGHHLVNRSGKDAVYLEVGSRNAADHCHYPDIDLHLEPDGAGDVRFTHKDGKPW